MKELYHQRDDQARKLETLQDGGQEDHIKDLKSQLDESNNLIATQEHQLEDYRVSKEKQQRELNSLRPYSSRVRELEDEVKELRSDNDSLSKKANMVEHFQRKLESLNATERENTSLRQRIDILQSNQKDYDKVHFDNEKLKNTQKEYEKKFETYEMDLTNQNAISNIYKNDLRAKDVEIETLKARQASDERFIQELQETIRSGNPAPFSPNSPAGGPGNLTLEEELAGAPDPTPNYLLEISRLQAENQLLKSGSAGTTNATLRIDLEESERIRRRLAENLRDLTEQQAISQKQLEAVLATSSNQKYVPGVDAALKEGPFRMLMDKFYRDNAIASTRDLERKATEELKITKAKLAAVQSELTSQNRDLLAAQADCKQSSNLGVPYQH